MLTDERFIIIYSGPIFEVRPLKSRRILKRFLDQSQVEVDRLASAFEIIAGSLKLSDEDWEIEDGEGNTLADTLLESELFSKAAYRAMKEKSGRVIDLP